MSEQGGDSRVELEFRLMAQADRIKALEAALREIKDQYLTPDQSSAIARAALQRVDHDQT